MKLGDLRCAGPVRQRKLKGESLPQKAGDKVVSESGGPVQFICKEFGMEFGMEFGEVPNSWCGGSCPTASAMLHTLNSACLSCRVGGVRVIS